MYKYKKYAEGAFAPHYNHTFEEWHAYVCDTSNAPAYVNGASTGLCCHTCSLIIVEV